MYAAGHGYGQIIAQLQKRGYKTKVSKELRKRYYYECNYGKRTSECSNKSILKANTEEYVLSKLKNKVLTDSNIPLLSGQLYKFYRNARSDSTGEGEYLVQEINKVNKQIDNIVEAISMGGAAMKASLDLLKNLENKKATLESRLHEWQIVQDTELITLDSIINYLKNSAQQLSSNDPATIRPIVEQFLEKVIIKKDTIEVTFKVSVVSSVYLPRF